MYLCTECRYESRVRLTRCPKCKAYDTMISEHNFLLKSEQDARARRHQMDAFEYLFAAFLTVVHGVIFFVVLITLQFWLLMAVPRSAKFQILAMVVCLISVFLGLAVAGGHLRNRPCIRWRKHQYHAIIGPTLAGFACTVIWIFIFFEVVLP